MFRNFNFFILEAEKTASQKELLGLLETKNNNSICEFKFWGVFSVLQIDLFKKAGWTIITPPTPIIPDGMFTFIH